MLATTVSVVVQEMVSAEAVSGNGIAQLSCIAGTPWFVWDFWLTIGIMLTIAGFHLSRRFMARRRERGRPRPHSA